MGIRKKIRLGDKVRDKLTDLEGTVTARTEYIYGCTQFEVTPRTLHEGKPVEGPWIDEPQLELVKPIKKIKKKKQTVPPHGGNRSHPR